MLHGPQCPSLEPPQQSQCHRCTQRQLFQARQRRNLRRCFRLHRGKPHRGSKCLPAPRHSDRLKSTGQRIDQRQGCVLRANFICSRSLKTWLRSRRCLVRQDNLRFPSHQSAAPWAHDALMTFSSSWCKRQVCQYLLVGERRVKGVHEVPHHMMSQLEHSLWAFCHPGTQVGDREAQVRPGAC